MRNKGILIPTPKHGQNHGKHLPGHGKIRDASPQGLPELVSKKTISPIEAIKRVSWRVSSSIVYGVIGVVYPPILDFWRPLLVERNAVR